MYPQPELSRLVADREAICLRIARNRLRCTIAMAQVAEPLAWVDRMVAWWHKYSTPLMLTALPLGFLLKRTISPKPRMLGAILRWGPLLFGVVRSIAGARHRPKAG